MKTLRETLSYTPVELGFGTSGLRGLVTDMTDLECYINTIGFIRFLKEFCSVNDSDFIALAGDLRSSTPRILSAVIKAIQDENLQVSYQGLIPTPAIAYFGLEKNMACIMVTGSHIPADRNGIKFYKPEGEVLKADEPAIKNCVQQVRDELYGSTGQGFDAAGACIDPVKLPEPHDHARTLFLERFTSTFPASGLAGKHIVVYQHSAVGRDLIVELLEKLGAKVSTEGRSDEFVPIDTENVTIHDQEYFKELAGKHPDAFAIVSTDGDSDRPFVIDEHGIFHRGDVLGALVATELQADFAAVPVSASDAVDQWFEANNIPLVHTAIGSPHVIVAMQQAAKSRVVGWEVNGGFLTGSDFEYENGNLKALPTRDAFLPILIPLVAAAKQSISISKLFAQLPERYAQAGLLDNFPREASLKIVETLAANDERAKQLINSCFGEGFGKVVSINSIDGVRMVFSSGDIAHIRPSGNAPQLRIYSVANSQERADEIVALGINENGILRTLEAAI